MSFASARPRSQTLSGGTPGRGPGADSSRPALILSVEMRLDSVIGCLYDTSGQWRELQRVTVRYDVDCPEYNTVDGVYRSTPNPSLDSTSLTPVEILVRAVDKLLEGLPTALVPSIGAISLAAVPSLPIFLASGAQAALQALSPAAQLSSLCTYPTFFAVPFSPNAQDYTAGAEARRILEIVGGIRHGASNGDDKDDDAGGDVLAREERRAAVAQAEEAIARRTSAGLSLGVGAMPAQIHKIRHGRAVGFAGDEKSGLQAAWTRTARIVSPGMLLEALLTGRIPSMHNIDAALTGLREPRSGRWDTCLMETVSSGSAEVLRAMLGGVEIFGRRDPSRVSAWMSQRFGFRQDCAVFAALPTPIAAFLSFLPEKGDAGLAQGVSDMAVIPSNALVTDRRHMAIPHPLAGLDAGSPSCLNLAPLPGAGEARKLVRDGYFHGSWRGYQRLVAALPIGGVAGMDNKLLSLYSAYGPLRGLRRYEHGVIVGEFSDLRANARCLVESQSFTVRAMAVRIGMADRALDPDAWACHDKDEELLKERRASARAPVATAQDSSTLPLRWFVWGQRVCGPSAEVLAAVSGGCVVASEDEAAGDDDEDPVAGGIVPAGGSPPRAALGAAFVALWLSSYHASISDGDGATTSSTFAQTIQRHLSGESDEDCAAGLNVGGLGALHPPRRRPRSLTTTAAMIRRSASLSIVREQAEQEQGEATPRARLMEVDSQPGDNDDDDEQQSPTAWTLDDDDGDHGEVGSTPPPLIVVADEKAVADKAPSKAEQERIKMDDERRRGLVRLAHADRDFFSVYSALFEEHLRLTELLERAEARAGVGC